METAQPIRSVFIACGENPNMHEEDALAAIILVTELVKRGITIVYGGSKHGLMGLVARTALSLGGKVIGVVQAYSDPINHQSGLTKTIVVKNIFERIPIMLQISDATVDLTGGIGTGHEIFAERDILKIAPKGVDIWQEYGIRPDRKTSILDPTGQFYPPMLGYVYNMGRAKADYKDMQYFRVQQTVDKILIDLGIMTRQEYDEKLERLAERYQHWPSVVERYLHPITMAEKKQAFRKAARLCVGAVAAATVAFTLPQAIPIAWKVLPWMDLAVGQMQGLAALASTGLFMAASIIHETAVRRSELTPLLQQPSLTAV